MTGLDDGLAHVMHLSGSQTPGTVQANQRHQSEPIIECSISVVGGGEVGGDGGRGGQVVR